MSTSFLSPGWRMPTNKNQSKSSNYSLDFIPTDIINVSGFSTALSNVNNGTRSSDNNLPFSWSVWFRSRNSSNSQGEIAGYGQTQRNGIRIHNNVFRSNYTSDLAGTTTISQNVWYHGIITYDGTTRRIYINGSLDASDTPASAAISSQALTIGVYPGGTSSFNGDLNELCYFDYALSPSQVTTLWGGGTSVSNPMAFASPPIAYYPLGTSAWNGNYLAENNAIGDYVFDFDGTSNYIDCGNDSSLQITGAMTVSYWFRGQGGDANYGGFGKLGGGGNRGFLLGMVSSGNITFYIATNASTLFSVSYTRAVDTNWHNLVGVYNPSTSVKIYLDGNLVSEKLSGVPASQYNGSNNLQIGARGDNVGVFNGEISNAQIFNAVLSSTEVETLYNYGSPIQTLANIPQNSNLKAWYKLDASEVYNSSTTEWSIDNNQNPSAYPSSLDFDGANDYINLGTTPIVTGIFTFSLWIKRSSTSSGAADQVIIGKDGQSSNRVFNVFMSLSGVIGFWVSETGGYVSTYRVNTSTLINDTNWHNLIVINNGDNNNNQVFIDGTEASYTLQGTGRTTLYNTTGIATSIGSSVNAPTNYAFNGKLSNASIWNTALTSAQVTEIYNNGTPSNLSSHSATSNLVSWYKLNNTTTGIEDSKGSNNGTNNGATEYPGFVNTLAGDSSGMSQANLVQSDLQTVAPYSKYAMSFDSASSDYIDFGNVSDFNFGTGDFTVSSWINISSGNSSYRWIFGYGQTTGLEIGLNNTTNNTLRLWIAGSVFTSSEGISSDTWHNLILKRESGSISAFLDNTSLTLSGSGGAGSISNNNTYIGVWGSGAVDFFQGSISNISAWNTGLTSSQISEIYNEGLPSNLNSHSAYSNLISWWQLGENSSFNGNDWIVADEVGSNNGESDGMPVGALTNGVGTTANGVSSGMAVGALVGDAPYSTANAISSGMSVVSRVTGSGNTP